MADDIVTRLQDAVPYGLEDTNLLGDAAAEIERLREIIKVTAPYELTWHIGPRSPRTRYRNDDLAVRQNDRGTWDVTLTIDGGYSDRRVAEQVMEDVWSIALDDACRILRNCYRSHYG